MPLSTSFLEASCIVKIDIFVTLGLKDSLNKRRPITFRLARISSAGGGAVGWGRMRDDDRARVGGTGKAVHERA